MLAATKLLAASRIRYKLSAPPAMELVDLTHWNAPGAVIMLATARLLDGRVWVEVTKRELGVAVSSQRLLWIISVNILSQFPLLHLTNHSISSASTMGNFNSDSLFHSLAKYLPHQ
jgi:hypothetical protein